ncbi:MAG: branched-chain amino acid ABC transporter permease [Stellaceae bacterium]
MRRSQELIAGAVLMLALALVPPLANAAGDAYFAQIIARAMIFGIAAAGLNFALGFGGMVSFGHAAFIGLGAYAVGMLMDSGITNGYLQVAVLLTVGGAAALVIGAICLRTSGLYFIMITLAFAQLFYFVGVGLKPYGGDDGFTFRGRSDFGAWLNLGNDTVFYYFVWAVLALSLFLIYRFVNARFGLALIGTASNERRMRSIGLPTYRYKLTAFVISGAFCTIAGGLLANLTQFVSPDYMHWTRSGDLLVMAIIGGMSSVVGPVLGAIVFLLLEQVLGDATEHWQAIMGPILILIVLFARYGLMGALAMRRRGVRRV